MLSKAFLSGILFGAAFAAFTVSAAQITIVPQMGTVYPGDFNAPPFPIARITSEFELRSASATLSTQTLSLAFAPFSNNEWRAADAFDISNIPSGTNVIRFSATDVFGNTAETNHVIGIDRFPVINVFAPAEGALARPVISSATAARDDLGTPTIVILNANPFTPLPPLQQRTTYLEAPMDFSTSEESLVQINFFAYDATRFGYLFDIRHMLSLSNPRYQPLMSLPGEIRDANAEAVLYLSRSNELTFVDRRSNQTTVLKTNFFGSNSLSQGERITPAGALVVNSGNRVLDFNRGEEIDLGTYGFEVFAVNGRFGLVNANGQTVLRYFVARTNYVFPFIAACGSVAGNGTAVVANRRGPTDQGNAVYRFANGQLTTLTDTNDSRFGLLTDGTNVLWSSAASGISLLTPQGLTQLATNSLNFAGDGVAMNGGWVAFPKPGAQSQQQIWLRSPAGEISQATFYSRNTHIRALQPDGSLLAFVEEIGIFHLPRGASPKRISNDFGACYFLTGTNFLASRLGHLFDLIVDGEPIGLTSPQHDSSTGILTYYVTSTQPALFTLLRSTNFVDWTAVTRQTVTNTLPTKFQTTTAPGFFRLRKE